MKLIVIDQDASFRAEVKKPLTARFGAHAIEEAESIPQLRDRLAGGDVDLIILADQFRHEENGGVSDFRAEWPDLAIVVIGGDDPERLRSVLKEGADGYIRRSDSAEQAVSATDVIMNGGVYIPPLLGIRPGAEKLMTSAGPVPAGFFRDGVDEQLTPRQKQVLAMIRDGWSNTDIAAALDVTVGTVKIHITAVFKALGVRNRTQAMIAAERIILPDPGPKPSAA